MAFNYRKVVLVICIATLTFVSMNEISVCIVDDNNELRSALQEIISMSDGYKCTGTMSTANEAIRKLPLIKPDVVLIAFVN
jgi:chemotaxis response regulator CheB